MRRILGVAACLCFAGCSGLQDAKTGGFQTPPATNANVSGPYEMTLTSTEGLPAGLIEVDFSQQGTAITDLQFAGLGATGEYPGTTPPADPSTNGGCGSSNTLTGTVSGNQVTLTQTSFGDSAPAGASFSMTGTVSANNPKISGTYTGYNPASAPQLTNCIQDKGTFVANQVQSASGSFTERCTQQISLYP